MVPFCQPGEEGSASPTEFFAVEKMTLTPVQTAIDDNDEQDGAADV